MAIIHIHVHIVASRDANLHIQKPNVLLKPGASINQSVRDGGTMYNDNQMDTINYLNVFRTVIVHEISDGCKDEVIQCNDECMSSICFQESEFIKKHMSRVKSNDPSRDNMFHLFSEHTD